MGRNRRASFRYTRSQARAIFTALEHSGLLARIDRQAVLNDVTSAARTALFQRASRRPYAENAAQQLSRVANESLDLLAAVRALHWSTDALLHSLLANAYIEPALEGSLRPLYRLNSTRLQSLLAALGNAAVQAVASALRAPHIFPPISRPKATALQAFIFHLCVIYHQATGHIPGLTRPTDTSFTKGRFYPFVVAAVEPTELATETQLDHHIRVATDAYRDLLSVPKRLHTRKVKTPQPSVKTPRPSVSPPR